MNKEKSIVYIAFGELYVAMALLSIKTLKKFDPITKITIITNLNFDPSLFKYWNKNKDEIRYIKDLSINNREYKTSLDKYIKSEKVAFFDCDTIFLSEFKLAWSFLDYFDIALKMNPTKQKKIGKGDIPILNNKYIVSDLPHFNSGVIFFRNSSISNKFFNLWNKTNKRINLKYDQISLIESLFISKIKILPLTSEWNFFPDINFYRGKIKNPRILHYTNRISYVIENELLKIAKIFKFNKNKIKEEIKQKRAMRRLKIGRIGWFKLRLIWMLLYKKEKRRLNLY